MKKQIVFVLSTNYAGSHFLTLQLASHSRCISLGEFHRFKRRGARRRQACSICATDEQCPVFHGLADRPVLELYDRVFANIAELDPEIVTGIDNSKKPEWAARFLELSDRYDLRFIHLIRDPRALVRRWMLLYDTPPEKNKVRRRMARRCWRNGFSILSGSEANVYVHRWAYENRRIVRFLESSGVDCQLLTYRELVHEPVEKIRGLMTWIGHSFEPEQLEYWRFEHHGSQKPQYMKKSAAANYHDLRWKEFLDESTCAEIAAHPQVAATLEPLGLALYEDGIGRSNS